MKDSEARDRINSLSIALSNKLNDKIYLRKGKEDNFITVSGSPFGYPYQTSTTVEVDVVELLESILDYLNLEIVPKNTRKSFTLVERNKE